MKRKTLLYKSGVEYADFCLNHVEGCAKQVIRFCSEKGIKHHIKFGTRRDYDKNTEIIFKKTCVMPVAAE